MEVLTWIALFTTLVFLVLFIVYFFLYRNKKTTCPAPSPVANCPASTPTTCPASTSTRLGPTFNPSSDPLVNDIINFTNIGIESFKPMLCQFVTSMEQQAIENAPIMTVAQAKADLTKASAQVPPNIKAQYLELGNRVIVATTTGARIDKTKAAALATKIKQMFCSGI